MDMRAFVEVVISRGEIPALSRAKSFVALEWARGHLAGSPLLTVWHNLEKEEARDRFCRKKIMMREGLASSAVGDNAKETHFSPRV